MPARRRETEAPASVYQLKVTLAGIRPPIWRRIQVPADITFGRLHDILQIVMGWEEEHLHEFEVKGVEYGPPEPEEMRGAPPVRNEHRARLNTLAPTEGSTFSYRYDFGDDWRHAIRVEKILPPEPGAQYPRCLTGKRSGPPEDCGGIWGYAELIETLQNPEREDYEEMRELVGDDFDPEAFSVETINAALRQLR